ncbi:PspA/IM30 family protein [Myxococcota bacterium]|nr:PspA/IM30 family protein [Myxococcota bacterium]
MGIIGRLFKIGEAKANRAVDGLEDPEIMLDQAIRDKEAAQKEAKLSVQKVIAAERKQKALVDKERENQATWEEKAQMALSAGNEEMAVKALQRSEEHEKNATALNLQWEEMRRQIEELKGVVREADRALTELKRNKEIIIAQAKAAEVRKNIYDAKANIGKNSETDDLIARMKAKAENTTYEADAAKEVAEEFGGGDKLEKDFRKLEAEGAVSTSVKAKLEAMKQKMGEKKE